MTKDTSRLVEQLKLCSDFKTFYDENKDYMITQSLSDMLKELIEGSGMRKTDIIKASEMSEVYAYQIFSGARMPERKKLLCLALAMKLNIEQAQKLLKTAGYAPLYVKIPFDCVVLHGLCNKLEVVIVNEMLFNYGLGTLS